MKLKHVIPNIFLLFILFIPGVYAQTRINSVHDFLDEVHTTDLGFSNTIDEPLNVITTTQAINVANIVGYSIKNKEDIILYYQSSQNPDFGFGLSPEEASEILPSLYSTIGLIQLGINSSQLQSWRIAEFINDTAMQRLYTDQLNGNETLRVPANLTISTLNLWFTYIQSMFYLNTPPTIPFSSIITDLQDLQLINGTYTNFDFAVYSTRLLSLFDSTPRDVGLSSLYLQAHIQSDGFFSRQEVGTSSLNATYHALSTFESLGILSDVKTQQKIILKILDLQKPNSGFTFFNSDVVTLESTWFAIHILDILDAIDELQSPDVLQTHGFISYQVSFLGLLVITLWRRKY